MKKIIGLVSGLAILTGALTVSSQAVNAAIINSPLGAAQDSPTSSEVKKGQTIIVITKDTKKQTISIYNKDAKKTHKTVKMGTKFTVKDIRKVAGNTLVKVGAGQWLNAKDVTQN